MNQLSDLSRILEQLGHTADEVAVALKACGVQGVRNTVQALNPLVRYVQSRIRLDVFGLDVMKGDAMRLTFGNGQKQEVALPQAVKDFLEAFNQGDYPELELPPEGS